MDVQEYAVFARKSGLISPPINAKHQVNANK